MFGKNTKLNEGTRTTGVVLEKVGPRETEGGGHADNYRITARVTFSDGSTTDTKAKLHTSRHGFYMVGQAVPVRYDPADHSKAEVDLPELEAQKQAARDERQQVANARAEQARNGVPTALVPPPLDRSHNVPAEVPDHEEADPLDRLTKLADLHDRGVLNDSEFADEKAKILGGAS
jgi:Short C-terminal domain